MTAYVKYDGNDPTSELVNTVLTMVDLPSNSLQIGDLRRSIYANRSENEAGKSPLELFLEGDGSSNVFVAEEKMANEIARLLMYHASTHEVNLNDTSALTALVAPANRNSTEAFREGEVRDTYKSLGIANDEVALNHIISDVREKMVAAIVLVARMDLDAAQKDYKKSVKDGRGGLGRAAEQGSLTR